MDRRFWPIMGWPEHTPSTGTWVAEDKKLVNVAGAQDLRLTVPGRLARRRDVDGDGGGGEAPRRSGCGSGAGAGAGAGGAPRSRTRRREAS